VEEEEQVEEVNEEFFRTEFRVTAPTQNDDEEAGSAEE
jgi:hypothetical protein